MPSLLDSIDYLWFSILISNFVEIPYPYYDTTFPEMRFYSLWYNFKNFEVTLSFWMHKTSNKNNTIEVVNIFVLFIWLKINGIYI